MVFFSNDTLSSSELKQHMDNGEDILLIDVRGEEEYNFCKINGSINLPLINLMTHFEKIDQGRPVVFICHHGVRSMQALKMLQSQGLENAASLKGGVHDWATCIDSSLLTY